MNICIWFLFKKSISYHQLQRTPPLNVHHSNIDNIGGFFYIGRGKFQAFHEFLIPQFSGCILRNFRYEIWFYLSFMGWVTSPYSLDLWNKMADLSGRWVEVSLLEKFIEPLLWFGRNALKTYRIDCLDGKTNDVGKYSVCRQCQYSIGKHSITTLLNMFWAMLRSILQNITLQDIVYFLSFNFSN